MLPARRILQASRGLATNAPYRPATRLPVPPAPEAIPERADPQTLLARHWGPAADAQWRDPQAVLAATRAHTLPSWGSRNASPELVLAKGDGVFVEDLDGKRYLDMNSQAMCANLGHSQPAIADAVGAQLRVLPHVWSDRAHHPLKARVAALLADVFPGDLNAFFFGTGGADANEAAMRMARLYTGRPKILARYRSYHGGTQATAGLTGDARRQFAGPGGETGVVHVVDPYPASFSWGESAAEAAERNLAYLREVVEMEGPATIAAMVVESVTGTNGVLASPAGYLEGVQALAREHGFLLIVDEVMSGFGRTGRWFGFEHAPGVLPDIVTAAKGVTSAYAPLGVVAAREHVAAHFDDHPTGCGSTYNAHPASLAAALATLEIMLREDIVGRVAALEPALAAHLDALAAAHPALVKQTRAVGLFGIADLQAKPDGTHFALPHDKAAHPDMARLARLVLEEGLFAGVHKSAVFTIPPLTITEEELGEGFERLGRALGRL